VRTHKRALSTLTLTAAMVFGVVAMAADLPKEGTFNGTISLAGTFKIYLVGKEHIVGTYDENGLTVGEGFYDHMTWHCFGVGDAATGMLRTQGRCVGTDPTGDQLVIQTGGDERHPMDAKTSSGSSTIIAGTGKYTGITGGATFVLHGSEFKTATEGTYANYGEIQAKYKLP
jgi:hypothetical protein